MTFGLGIIIVGLASFAFLGMATTASATDTKTKTPPSSSTPTKTTPLPSSGNKHGLVTTGALATIGRTHGWGPAQIADWFRVVMAESNGTLTDTNPSSGAYGIAQFINGPSEYYTYGGNPNTLSGQLTAMGNYIAQRYGSPSAAWAHEQANHWY